jgi:hypothetical protein
MVAMRGIFAWFVIKETTDTEQNQRSEGKYGNDKGYGRIA